jgi:hypothetical protein
MFFFIIVPQRRDRDHQGFDQLLLRYREGKDRYQQLLLYHHCSILSQPYIYFHFHLRLSNDGIM